jgi:hypothetical protein
MGGTVADGAVALPPLQLRQVRRLAELELRRLLHQVRVGFREDAALALPGTDARREHADLRERAA